MKLEYKLHRKLKVFNKTEINLHWSDTYNLVDSSPQHGVVFVASMDGLLSVYRVAELLDCEADPSRVTVVKLVKKPVLISVNCDGELLAVGLPMSVLIYNVKDFPNQVASPKLSVPRGSKYLRDMQWSPSMNETLAIGFFSKITILHVGSDKKNDIETASCTRCLSWHPNGSSLVVGDNEGVLSVYSPDLTLEKRIPVPDPPLFDEADLFVEAVNWMATNQFAVVYSDASTNDDSESVFTLINASEEELPPRAEYVGRLESGVMDYPRYRLLQIKPWNVMLCIRNGKVVTVRLPPGSDGDDSQAPVQLVSELLCEDDQYLVGVAVDRVPVHLLSSQSHLHEPTDETTTVLHGLTTTRDLVTYIVSERPSTPSVDTESSGTTPCSEPVALEPPLIDSNGSFNASTASASPFGGGFKTTTNNAFGAQPAFGAAATAQPATGGGGGPGFGASTSTGGGPGFGASTSTGGWSGFGASTSTGGGPGFGASTSTGGGPGFGASTSTGGWSGFGASTSTGGWSGFGASTSTGGWSGFGASTSTGGGPGFGASTSTGGGPGFGASTSTGGWSGFGASTSTGGGPGFGASTSTGGGPGFGASTSTGGWSGFGASTSTGGWSGFGASTSTGGGPGFGASTSTGGGPGFGASTSTGGWSGFGASTSTGGWSGFGASTSTGGGPGFGASTSTGGWSGFGASTSTGGRPGFGASTSPGRQFSGMFGDSSQATPLFGTPTPQLFQAKPAGAPRNTTQTNTLFGTSKRAFGATSTAAPCTGDAPHDLPPLGFHSVHGENIMISRDGSGARRVVSSSGGVAFSARPVRVNEKVCIRLVEISHNWHGVISFGFTTHNPTTLSHALPKTARPGLTNKPGNWAQALEESFCVKDNILYYFVNSAGDVRFGINGEDKGLFFSSVDTRSPLWALVDVYGRCTAVQFADPRAPSLIRRPYQTPVKSVKDARIISRRRTLLVNDRLPQLRYQSSSTGGGSGFGASTSTGGGSGFGASTSTGAGSGFGASTSTGGGSGFGASTSTGGGSGFGASTSTGGGSGFGASTSTGGGSGFGASTSTGGGSGFGASTSTGGGSGFGASTSTGGGSGFGASTSTGGGSGFGASTSTGGGSGFGASTSTGGGSGFGASTSTGGGSGFGASTSTGGGSGFGASTSTGGGSGFGASTSTGGGSGFGASTSTGGGSGFGASTSTGGGSGFGASTSTGGGSGFGASTSTGGGSGFGASTSTCRQFSGLFGGMFGDSSQATPLFGTPTPQLFQAKPAGSSGQSAAPGTAQAKYSPVVGTDVVVKAGASQNINVKHHCITCMKEYEKKSLDELRLEDYMAGRKGSAAGVFGSFSQQPKAKPHSTAPRNTTQTRASKPAFGAMSTAAPHTPCTGGGPHDFPPLGFHSVHGENIRISRDGSVARRVDGYCGGMAFSARPVRVNEMVCIRFVEISNSWSGVTSFGFTTHDPTTLSHALPKTACPGLANKPGNWVKAFCGRFCEKELLYYYVNSAGGVHFGVNGEYKGLFFSGVDTRFPLWALVDVYGSCTAVQFVDPRAPGMIRGPNQSPVKKERLISGRRTLLVNDRLPQLRYQSSFIPLCLHLIKGRNVQFTNDRRVAARIKADFCQGYVFTARPMPPGQTIVVQILSTETACAGSLAIGLTSCDPATLRPCDLPDDAEQLLDRPEYWVVRRDMANGLGRGAELAITLTLDGEVRISRNGSNPVTEMHVDHTVRLWAFVDIYGATQKVRMLCSQTAQPPPPQLRALAGSAQYINTNGGTVLADSLPPQNANQQMTLASAHTTTTEPIQSNQLCSEQVQIPNERERDEPSTSTMIGEGQLTGTECTICYENPIDSVLYMCGHMYMCYSCAVEQWKGKGDGQCPLCRAEIKDVIRTYKS